MPAFSRSTRGARLRALAPALLAALAAAALAAGPGAAAAQAGAPLPDAGLPLPVLLREAPSLATGSVSAGASVPAVPAVPAAPAALTAALAPASLDAPAPAAPSPPVGRSARTQAAWVPGSIVQVRRGQEAVVHSAPHGSVVEVFDDSSDQGAQARAFTVYRVAAGGWLGVSVAALHGGLGWIKADPSRLVARPALDEVRVSLRRRTLTLLRRGRIVIHTLAVIGAAGTPTPAGHFTVDDKLRFAPADPAYGAGVLALSVPPPHRDWRLWRVAIHGMNDLGTLGGTGSLGCVHVPDRQLHKLLAGVPVGTPVDITA
jgi:hypothetical protein